MDITCHMVIWLHLLKEIEPAEVGSIVVHTASRVQSNLRTQRFKKWLPTLQRRFSDKLAPL